ncbi:YhgE/Pip domain-containing protein [Dietzia sp.]|uniref:YhgE/Pip domain-containing protein n=1 Tax=Dietzia sp. TaxID=1871616 RepID=UPI002FDA6CA3
MKSILSIIGQDFRSARNSVMTAVVIFGLTIVPLLFSSFNVLASWDPFSNTDELKIAVASTDEGYESDLLKLRVNLGDQVLSKLSTNDQIDWVITSEDDAIEGTESGEYYASIVLPPTFSADLLTFYVEGTDATKLALYTNEKKNALSTKITSQGADGVIDQINSTFTQTVSNVGFGLLTSLEDFLESDDVKDTIDRIESRIGDTASRLHSGAQTARAFNGLIDSSLPLVEGAGNIVNAAGEQLDDPTTDIGSGSSATENLSSTLRDTAASLGTGLRATSESYETVGNRIDELLGSADTTSTSAAQTYDTLALRVQQQADALRNLRTTLDQGIGAQLPDQARPGYDRVMTRLNSAVDKSQNLHDDFAQSARDIRSSNASAQDVRQGTTAAIAEAKNAVNDAATSYQENLRPQLTDLGSSLQTLGDDVTSVKEGLGRVGSSIADSPGSLSGSLGRASETTRALADRLDLRADQLTDLQGEVRMAGETGDLSRISDLIGSDPEALAAEIASPVAVDRQAVYPVASFGAGMAPLYTVLALWIGALLAAVMLNTGIAPGTIPARGYTRSQAYLGKFGLFASIGFAQSTLAVLGLLVFVEIGAVHPFYLFICGWTTSLVFMATTYTLVLTFGSVGKALSVLILVFQVSGAGGSYPLQLLPSWAENLSPWLPATHAINAMRAAIADIYRADMWIELGLLCLFVVPILFLGLTLRRVFEGNTQKMSEAIESTKVMS